mgnify:CR=1 FL=1
MCVLVLYILPYCFSPEEVIQLFNYSQIKQARNVAKPYCLPCLSPHRLRYTMRRSAYNTIMILPGMAS